MELSSFVNIVYIILLIGVTIGGLVTYRMAMHRTAQEIAQRASDIQDHVISALNGEIDLLTSRLDTLEKKNVRLEQTLGIIKSALKKKGIIVTIDGDIVIIQDDRGNTHEQRITGAIQEAVS